MGPKKDLTGQTFGRLKAERYMGGSLWECVCECGGVSYVKTSNLTNGHTRSCGCMARKQSAVNGAKVKDLTGQRFGKLVALRYLGRSTWELRCDCGKLTSAHQGNLRKGQKTSCGCSVTLDRANKKNQVEGTNVGSIRNGTLSSRNKTGVRGVHYSKTQGVYIATIAFQGRQYYLKASKHIEDCITARKEAEAHIFGDFLAWYDEQEAAIKTAKKEEDKT